MTNERNWSTPPEGGHKDAEQADPVCPACGERHKAPPAENSSKRLRQIAYEMGLLNNTFLFKVKELRPSEVVLTHLYHVTAEMASQLMRAKPENREAFRTWLINSFTQQLDSNFSFLHSLERPEEDLPPLPPELAAKVAAIFSSMLAGEPDETLRQKVDAAEAELAAHPEIAEKIGALDERTREVGPSDEED